MSSSRPPPSTADEIWLQPGPADQGDGYLDGTRAVLDDLEIRVFHTEAEALACAAAHEAAHPMVYEAAVP